MKTRPYIIVTPTYCADAHVRVLHLLCHELNSLGLDARLLLTEQRSPSPEQILNRQLHTPLVHPQMEGWDATREEAIFIYTDEVPGNPCDARRIVRYVMGKETPRPDDDPGEYRLYYSKACAAQRQGKNHSLFLLPVDLGLFNDKGVTGRDQDLLWLGKGAAFCTEPPPHAQPITPDWPATREELAAQLRRTRFLYSYDAAASINVEAVLCGAVVVLMHLDQTQWEFKREELEAREATCGGFAFGDSHFEIERAGRTRIELVENMRQQVAGFRQRLLEFVGETQLHFK